MVRSLPLLARSGRAHERVCGCMRECVYDGERESVTTLHLWEWIMCQSGLQVACRAAALQRGGRKAGKGSSTLETLMVLH